MKTIKLDASRALPFILLKDYYVTPTDLCAADFVMEPNQVVYIKNF